MISNNWAKDAACVGTDIDFYSQNPAEKKKAKALCFNECPVRWLCAQAAMDNGERFGIWGGADEIELRKNQGIDADGNPHVSTQGKVRCTFCGPLSTKYLRILQPRKRSRTNVECVKCGLKFTVRRRINDKQTNW